MKRRSIIRKMEEYVDLMIKQQQQQQQDSMMHINQTRELFCVRMTESRMSCNIKSAFKQKLIDKKKIQKIL